MDNNIDIDLTKEDIEMLLIRYNATLRTLETHLDILIKDYEYKTKSMPVDHVKSRIKQFDSAITKLKLKNYSVSKYNIIHHVHDMVGIRIVCSFLDDVYNIVDLIKSSSYIKVNEEKDYIKNPKKTGYSSYHLLVFVPVYLESGIEMVEAEIQIRTMAMDFWASLDHKIQYKFDGKVPEDIKEEMRKCSFDINNLDNKMRHLNEIMQKYVKWE